MNYFTDYFLINDNEKIVMDLWGGHHVYYKSNNTYNITRDCGFFSNFTVSMFGVFILTINGYDVYDLKITMTDYSFEDIHPFLFEKNNGTLSFKDIPNEDIVFFYRNCYPSFFGLGFTPNSESILTKENFNLEITNRIINKFFTPNQKVMEIYNKMSNNKKLPQNEYVFIWARRTDKVEETGVPNAKKYFEVLESNNLLNERIFVQTDDPTMFDEFKEIGLNFEHFEEIPFAKGYSFHRNAQIRVASEEEFFNNFKITKIEHLCQILCIALFASNSKKCIIYPGNGTTVVPMYKKSFNNCFLFKDTYNLF